MKTPILLVTAATASLVAATASADPCHESDSPTPSDVCNPREIYFMPGVETVVYAPRGAKEPFIGAGVQLAPVSWSHNNDRFGPSQGSVFFQAALLKARETPGTMALYEGGATLSLERNSSRTWAIPYFGATVGGVQQPSLPSVGYTYPMLGVHALWHPNLMMNLEGGYVFPFESVDAMRGVRGQMTVRFSMW
jgi:hypothetical protein